jgi:ElaB/YqjD/DUF883 family membrane-anchored ribosome-binding protein
MPLDIQWTLTVHVPQLDTLEETLRTLGEAAVAEVQGIKDQLARLNEGQAQGFEAIAAQLNAILAEMQQYSAGEITQDQLEKLEAALKTSADNAEKQAADIRANTEQLMQIVPDAPTPPA